MTPERWRQIDKLLELALDQKSSERADFLEKACAGDEELRREVEALLAAHGQAGSFIEAPALGVAARGLDEGRGELLVGQQVGSYKILSLLGKGGMGEVYLAEDSRLGRKIALKFLPAQFTQDQDRVRRFEREARAASALNHPNILTIHEVGKADGATFIATEFIDGQTLRALMLKKRLEVREMLDIGIQVCSALAVAHESHIAHRDIKPENIMLRRDGYVKVLDFGLAKLTEPRLDSQRPGTGTLFTETGMMMGTVQYMSPEQALGQELDHRTDLFSLGAVLYEMAAGTTAFKGNTIAALCNAILHETPASPRQLHSDLPEELERIITKALEKDREIRYQTASDLRADLKGLQWSTESKQATNIPDSKASHVLEPTPHRVARWKRLELVATISVLLVGLGLALYIWRRERSQPEIKQRQLTTNSSETHLTAAAISPDGKYLAYADETGIYLRLIDSAERHSLSSPVFLEGSHLAWFPDGMKLLASGVVDKEKVSSVWKISILGGRPVKVRDDVELASVSPNGSQIAFVSGGGKEIWLMGAAGEEPRRLLAASGRDIFPCLVWFPNGQRLGYVKDPQANHNHRMDVESCDLKGGSVTQILSNLCVDNLSVLPDGKMIYSTHRDAWTSDGDPDADLEPLKQSGGSLWEIRTDMRTGSGAGRPRRIISWPGFMVPKLSASGDGKRLILVKESGNTEIYVGELEETERRMKPPKRLTFDDHWDFPADWTPDSKAVLFTSDRNGNEDIFKQALDEREAEPIVAGPEEEYDPTATPDGSSILYFARPTGVKSASAHSVSLRLALIAGGPAQLVLSEEGLSLVKSPRSSSNFCLVDERNQKELVFYDFDFSKGKGRELARIDLPPKLGGWSLSPDGLRVAIMFSGEQKNRIQILPLGGGASSEVTVNGWTEVRGAAWAADGKGWFVSAYSPGSDALLYVDLQGHAQVVWRQPSIHGGIWGIPSPDGRYLAFPVIFWTSNAWLIEGF